MHHYLQHVVLPRLAPQSSMPKPQPAQPAPQLVVPAPQPSTLKLEDFVFVAAAPQLAVHAQKKCPSSSPANDKSSHRPPELRSELELTRDVGIIDAKCKEYIDELDTIDACDLMDPNVTK